jgi:hypothetical protein
MPEKHGLFSTVPVWVSTKSEELSNRDANSEESVGTGLKGNSEAGRNTSRICTTLA